MNNKYSQEEIKKIANELSNKKQEIIEDLNDVRFYEAKEKYESLLSFIKNNFPKKDENKEVNIELIGLRIYFLGQEYEKVLKYTASTIDVINKNIKYPENIKSYFKSFVYNIQLISALFLDDINLANKARKDYEDINVELEKALVISLTKQYPIYHYLYLEKFFELEFYTDRYSKEKLDFILKYCENMHNVKVIETNGNILNKDFLIGALNKQQNDIHVQKIVEILGNPQIDGSYELGEPETYYTWEESGVEATFENGILKTIFLYVEPKDGFLSCEKYCDENDLLLKVRKNRIIELLGQPDVEKKGGIKFLGIEMPKLIRYDYDDYSISYSFNEASFVTLITIMKEPPVKKHLKVPGR